MCQLLTYNRSPLCVCVLCGNRAGGAFICSGFIRTVLIRMWKTKPHEKTNFRAKRPCPFSHTDAFKNKKPKIESILLQTFVTRKHFRVIIIHEGNAEHLNVSPSANK